ncbi:RNA polymerase subunit sigma-70 [Pelobium manganitolerans]|uniref:RNA polymerase subunit sigma-70 n=1 Tax=Pelobium manganitolerans TaxID=1842495 RepID=A0A419S7J7_9SPHI|nr:RNA polymerase sigma factor [Pelobium manganitolerans]RKD17290.1 RNA polymerase subunit sigma-70 [Pelobium manganitolerans]
MKQRYTLEELVVGCQKGNRQSQELLYKSTAAKMLGICMRYAKDRFEAEDMMQTGYIKVFKKLGEYRGEGSFEGWMRRIMVNTSIEFYRKNLRNLNVVDIDEDVNQQWSSDFDMSQIHAKDLMRLVQNLSNGYRLVFNMYAIEGYSHKEIAEKLGITEGASKSQLSRARAILKEQVLKLEGYKNETNVG